MRVCLPVRSYITMSIIFVKLWSWLGPPLAALRCDMLCISGFVYNVVLAHSLPSIFFASRTTKRTQNDSPNGST